MVNKHNVYNVGLKEAENCPLPSHNAPNLPIRTPNDNQPVVIDPVTGQLYTRDPQVSPADLEAAEKRLGNNLEQKVEEIKESLENSKKDFVTLPTTPKVIPATDYKGNRINIPYGQSSTEGATLVQRSDNGHINVPYPTNSSHAPNKDYVDQQIEANRRGTENYVETNFSPKTEVDDKINVAKEELAEDFVTKSNVSTSSTPETIVKRDTSGRINIGYPMQPSHGVNKQFVIDELEALKNNISGGGLAFVYNTFEQFVANVLVEGNTLVSITDRDGKVYAADAIPLGTDVLIIAESVPDYWLSRKTLIAGEGLINLFSQYEAKVKLDNYYNKNETDSKFDEKLNKFKQLTGEEIENGTFEDGEIIYCTATSDFFTVNTYYIYTTSDNKFKPIQMSSAISITPSISTFNVNTNPSSVSTYEIGKSFTITEFSGTLKKYLDFKKLTVTVDSSTVGEITNITSKTFSKTGLNYSITKNTATTVTANIKGYDGVGGQVGSNSKTLANYYARQYFGIAPSNPNLETMTSALATSYYKNITANTDEIKTYLQSSRPSSITLNLSDTPTYVWFIIPTNLSISKMTSGGFDFPFIQQSNITINNQYGVDIAYKVYRSANKIYGTTTINLS